MKKTIIKLIFLIALLVGVFYIKSMASAQTRTVKIYRSATDGDGGEDSTKEIEQTCTSASLKLYKHMYIQIPFLLEKDSLNPELKVNIYELMKRWCKNKGES